MSLVKKEMEEVVSEQKELEEMEVIKTKPLKKEMNESKQMYNCFYCSVRFLEVRKVRAEGNQVPK